MSKLFKKYLLLSVLACFAVLGFSLPQAASAQGAGFIGICGGSFGACGGYCNSNSCSGPWVRKHVCNGYIAECRNNSAPWGQSFDWSAGCGQTVQLDVYSQQNDLSNQYLLDFAVYYTGDCGPGPTNPPGPTTPVGGNKICGETCSSTSDCRTVPGKNIACVAGFCHNTACSGASVGAGCDCVDSLNRVCGQSCGNGSLCGTNSNGIVSACTFVQGPACSQNAFVNGMYGICTPRLAAGDEYGDLFSAAHLNGNWAVCSNDSGALYLSNGSQLANMTEAARIQRMCEWCGNGVVEASNNEQCDNGNQNGPGNACSDTCQSTVPTATPVSCGGPCTTNAQCAANHTCSSSGQCILATCGIAGMFCGTDPNNQCGVICPSVTMSNPSAGVGQQVTFTCTTVPGSTSYSFRVHLPNQTFVDVAGVGSTSTSQPYTITMPGHHDVQCRYCNGASCSSFQTT